MPGDIEARMNFIIEQQAQFTADMQLLAADITALKERQSEAQRQIDENRGMIRQLVDVSMSLARHGQETDRRIGNLGAETDRRIRELAESGTHTDRRLDALINAADGYEETDRRLAARIEQLAEAGAHTDRRLDALIDTVDKLARRIGSWPAPSA